MHRYRLSHLSDAFLLHALQRLVQQERATTADVLAHIAEVDARKLYLPAAHPSMFEYCLSELGFSEDAAYKRIQAARAARQFPALFALLAEGRLHLTGVNLLAPHLTAANADELLQAAAGKRKSEIEEWLARRFPRSELLPLVQALPATEGSETQLAPAQVRHQGDSPSPAPREAPIARPRLEPIAQERYALQVTIGKEAHDQLRYAQSLLGHRIPSGDLASVLERVIHIAVQQLEKRKFAATDRPRRRRPRRRSANPRHIPAGVKRAVWERDAGQCTYVSQSGRRCPARTRLDFDHIEPVAHGGQATVANLRLRCSGHNQHAAECAFGAGFMSEKRAAAQRAAEQKRLRAAAAEEACARAAAAPRAAEEERQKERDVVPWLRALGFRVDQARRAAEHCESIPDAPLEERVRRAIAFLAPPHHRPRKDPWRPI